MQMKNDTPLVSIVIPVYNGANYLREAIDSALAQTYPHIEIIVVNDGSKDDGATERIALSYGDKIRYFRKENGGSSSALNTGIINMKGQWFSWLSHDDLYLPEKVEKQIAHMNVLGMDTEKLSEHIFFSDFELIDAEGKRIVNKKTKHAAAMAEKIRTIRHNGYLIAEPTVNIFHGCSCLIHREAFTQIGCFDEKLRLLNDLDLWYRLYSAGYQVHYIPEVLVKGRVHRAQVSKSIGYSYHNPEQDLYWNRSLDWLLENYPEEEELFFLFGRNAYRKGRNAEGDRAFRQIRSSGMKKVFLKSLYQGQAYVRNAVKQAYLKIKS